ncbi:MAG: quinoprotein relay system zinc metallohydrolase 1 [Sphingomonadales bacterium]|nr:quinoprotein relay system zinc metallohydrolase 1 [Sphingomonadales bacterium]MDE2570588.1 quinoprotein relay system zinc metallohydrolase 1 [Sphingomonadales bacterium]
MKFARRSVLSAALAVPLAARAEQFGGTYAPRPRQIADGVWVVRGADEAIAPGNGGAIANSTIIATDAGTVLVDPGPSLDYAKTLAAAALSATGKPVTRVYVTHLHPDHALGLGAFDPAIAFALPGTIEGLKQDGDGYADAMYRILAGWMLGTQVVVPQGRVTPGPVEYGGRRLTAWAMAGHSRADLVLRDEPTGTLITGDLVFHDRAPATPDADLAQWRAALDALAVLPHRLLVPGHGPVEGSEAAIAQTRDWLEWLGSALRTSVGAGLDMAEAGEQAIPGRFAAVKLARYELQRSVSHFYPRLEAEMLPRIDAGSEAPRPKV